MCCLFTCLGWVIDLIQRVWTFTMSCCISSAVCCTLVIASMAGVALGYNYSLAEYTETRETNVSVYLKRGVFDDSLVDEMDWRRKGGGPPPEEQEEVPTSEMYPARRSGGSIFDPAPTSKQPEPVYESNEHHQFEGSLIKLTANPVKLEDQVVDGYTQNSNSEQMQLIGDLLNRRNLQYTSTVAPTYQIDSYTMDQVKAVQDVINRRKMAYRKFLATRSSTEELFPMPTHTQPYRRMMQSTRHVEHPAIADEDDTDVPKWYRTKSVKEQKNPFELETPRLPLLPGGGVRVVVKRPHTSTLSTSRITPPPPNFRKSLEDDGTFSAEDGRRMEYKSNEINLPEGKDYDEKDIQGIPVRRKRKADFPIQTQSIENVNENSFNVSDGNSMFKMVLGIFKFVNFKPESKASRVDFGKPAKLLST